LSTGTAYIRDFRRLQEQTFLLVIIGVETISYKAKMCLSSITHIYTILSAVPQKLNVFGHRLRWTIFLVLTCGTRAQGLSAVSVTPCIYTTRFVHEEGEDVREEIPVLLPHTEMT
jgi:hypothetical protein